MDLEIGKLNKSIDECGPNNYRYRLWELIHHIEFFEARPNLTLGVSIDWVRVVQFETIRIRDGQIESYMFWNCLRTKTN